MKYDFFNNQKIKGISPYGDEFKGWVNTRSIDNSHLKEQIVVNDQGQWLPLNELTHIQMVGTNLREKVTDTIRAFVNELDPKKVKNINDSDKQALYNVAIKKAGEDGEKNEEEVKKIVDESLMTVELENSTDSDSSIVQKYMKESTIIDEPNNPDKYNHSMNDEDYGENEDDFDKNDDPMEHGENPNVKKDEVMDSLLKQLDTTNDVDELANWTTQEYGYSDEEAQELVEQAIRIHDETEKDVLLDVDGDKKNIDENADSLFSDFMDDLDENEGISNIDVMYEALCNKFDLVEEGKQALKESNGDYYDAILKMAEIFDEKNA